MTKKRLRHIEQKKMTQDCWALDDAFMEWLYPRLKTYLKDGGKFIDLDHYKFYLDGVGKTQREAIERMIFLLEELMNDDLDTSIYWNDAKLWLEYQKELCGWWGEVLPAMWW